jgi:glucose/arabinose dehydrogenase
VTAEEGTTIILKRSSNISKPSSASVRLRRVIKGALALVICAHLFSTEIAAQVPVASKPLRLTPHRISLGKRKTFNLYLPKEFEITVAAKGLRRARFMAESPDKRIFVTDMYNRTDNSRGAVYILGDFNEEAGYFASVTPFLTNLRNPNSIAFYTDKGNNTWFYLALTDRLVRYRYREGESAPASEPEVLATFPDYGLNYKYGGWHLTRTVVIGSNEKLYVAVGSSCNACEEKEEIRASVVEMDPDGKNQRIFARGLRNAVGVKWADKQLFVTNMGADHLGNDRPEDTMYIVEENANYGWPYCYQYRSDVYEDPQFKKSDKKLDCKNAPLAYRGFGAHSSPLGFERFDSTATDANLKNSFLVALHGSSKLSLRRGYSIVRVRKEGSPQDFVRGFLQGGRIYGRPADVMRRGADSFLFTDDHAGVVYYVFKKKEAR